MALWRKRTDGFDWHKYVRTTIQLRRDQRRDRLDDIGRAAAGQAKNAAVQAKRSAGAAAQSLLHGVSLTVGAGWRAAAAGWRKTIARPEVALPVVLIGVMALLSGLHRWITVALDLDTALPLGIGVALLVLAAPLAVARLKVRGWGGGGSARVPLLAKAVAATLLTAGALGWLAWFYVPHGFAPQATPLTTAKAEGTGLLEGHPIALSGEMIRLQGRLLHLAGIEAPYGQQTCTRANAQSWRCGEAALAALERLSRSKTFHCLTRGAPDAAGRTEANCTVDGQDVAAELVKDGHVFSAATFFGGYAALETEARRAGSGLWAGDPERPADYRAKLWSEAKANAPEGCPIKGQVSGRRKTYLMPWSARYATATVRPARGERWFCGEAEAAAAGFTPLLPGKSAIR